MTNGIIVDRDLLRDVAQLLSGSMFTFISTEEQARTRGLELYALLDNPPSIVPSPALEANRLAEKIEDMIEEFGDDPKAALDCISEWISFSRHNPSPALEANQQVLSEAFRVGLAALESAFLAGFLISGEGWNGEYGCDDPEKSPSFVKQRDEFIAALSDIPKGDGNAL